MSYAMRHIAITLGLSFFSHAQDGYNQNASSAASGNMAQTAAAAGDLAVDTATCNPPLVIPPCLKIVPDLLSMLGSMKAGGENENANNITETESPSANTNSDGKSNDSSRNTNKEIMAELCKKAPTLCDKCANSSDPDCNTLKVPQNLLDAKKTIDEKGLDTSTISLLPESLQNKEGVESLLNELDNIDNTIADINKILDPHPDSLGSPSFNNASSNRTLASLDTPAGFSTSGTANRAVPISSFMNPGTSQNPVKFIGLDVEDLHTGKRLTLFERAKRRYQGTQDFPRAFTLARMELMRSRALAEKIRIDKFIAAKKEEALAAAKNPPIKH